MPPALPDSDGVGATRAAEVIVTTTVWEGMSGQGLGK